MQTVITLIIVAAAAAFTVYRIVRFIRKPDDHACSPEKCANCPLASAECAGRFGTRDERQGGGPR